MTHEDRQHPSWRSGDLVTIRGERCRIDETESWPDCLALRLVPFADRSMRRTLIVPFDRPQRVERPRGVRTVKPRRWLHVVRRALLDAHPFGGLRAATRCPIQLLPYQLEPALAVLRHGVTRVLIADSVGLGKTIQAGLIARELASRSDAHRVLVLVPAGLRDQWAQELATHFDIHAIQADAAWLRSITADLPQGINPWSMPGVYIASVDFAKRPEVLRPIEDVTWDLTVVDEAHQAAIGTDRRAAAHAIASRSRRVVLLTATPHVGEPGEFDALTRIGRIGERGSPIVMFRRGHADVGASAGRRTVLLRVRLSAIERRMHDLLDRYTMGIWNEALRRRDARARLVSIVLRKRALSSASSLAASVRRRLDILGTSPPEPAVQLSLPLTDEDPIEADAEPAHALAAPGLSDERRERRWLAAIAQAASHAAYAETKTARLLRLLEKVAEPVIVFTEYRDTLNRLERAIGATGRPLVVLHGGMDAAERRRVQERFNRGGVSLLATDAASEGLNLHRHCRVVIHFELPWSASRIEQRAGRVDRFGQSRRVHEIALVAAGTAERLVLAPLARRAAQARAARQNSGGLLDALTESRIADAIFDGEALVHPVPSSDIPAADVQVLDLRIEAAAEVMRIARLGETPQRPDATSMTPAVFTAIRRRRSSPPAGVALALLVTVRDDGGRAVHTEPRVLHVADWRILAAPPFSPDGDNVSAEGTDDWSALLRLLRSLPSARHRPLSEACQRFADAILEQVRPLHAHYLAALREREEAMLTLIPSASVQLVQAGLFERRALHAIARRRESQAMLTADAAARLDDWSQVNLTAEVGLLAAILIGRNEHR